MKKKKFSVGLLFVYLVLVIWALTTIYPLIWVVMNSFKDKKQIVSNSFSFPVGALFTLDNYEKAINKFSIFTAYRNSLLISCTVAAVVILFAGLASYALVRYKFKGSGLMNSLVIAAMMFPVFATIIPVFRMESSWHIVNTNNLWLALLSCALPQIAGNLAFAIVVLSGYIKGLPVELEEAAYMEGCKCLPDFLQGYYAADKALLCHGWHFQLPLELQRPVYPDLLPAFPCALGNYQTAE